MKVITISSVILVVVLVASYLFVRSDAALLGDEVCLKIAATDVLGNPFYGESCPQSSYANEVESLDGSVKGGATFFKFRPVGGKEAQCPPISVIVDRKTGEAWFA
jgi:hypothetical protein